MNIYETTMDRDRARSFYYFPKSYYEYMKENMGFETEYFYAYKDGVMVAASVFRSPLTNSGFIPDFSTHLLIPCRRHEQ